MNAIDDFKTGAGEGFDTMIEFWPILLLLLIVFYILSALGFGQDHEKYQPANRQMIEAREKVLVLLFPIGTVVNSGDDTGQVVRHLSAFQDSYSGVEIEWGDAGGEIKRKRVSTNQCDKLSGGKLAEQVEAMFDVGY